LANIWKKDFPEEKIPAFDASPNLDNLINRSHYVFKWFSLVLSERQKNLPENLEVVRQKRNFHFFKRFLKLKKNLEFKFSC
jgi:uncharacterized protein (DUF2344 family)